MGAITTVKVLSAREVSTLCADMRMCQHFCSMLPASCLAEASEHDLVIKQLQPMDKDRRCYRMIGDVLVERTVGETLPAGGLRTLLCMNPCLSIEDLCRVSHQGWYMP